MGSNEIVQLGILIHQTIQTKFDWRNSFGGAIIPQRRSK